MKKFLFMSMTAAALTAGPVFAADSSSDSAALQAKIEAMQKQIDALSAKVGGQDFITRDEANRLIANEINASVDTKVEAGLAQMKDSSPILSLGKGIDNLTITGDVRTRWEGTRYNFTSAAGVDSSSNRSRFRAQLHLGGIWKAEGWEVGVGFVGGASNDPRSNNRDFSSGTAAESTFSKSGLWLDYAYAKHTWGDLSLTVGQQKNPYISTWIMWDADVRPAGVTLQYSYEGAFVTAGVYDVQEPGYMQSRTGYLGAGQIGYKYTQDNLELLGAIALYSMNHNGTDTASGVAAANKYGYRFNLGDAYGHIKYKFDPVTATLYGEMVKNFGANTIAGGGQGGVSANPSSDNTAWILGAKAQYEAWTANYGYAHIESDAVNGAVNDSDFAAAAGKAVAANIKGHKVELTYNVTKNLALSGRVWFVKEILPTVAGPKSGRLYMVDATWSF